VDLRERAGRGVRSAQAGLLINAALALIKLLAGIIGHSYALVADALESTLDIFSSLIVWGGLRISTRSADEAFPFGYGKAEPLATVIVSFLLLGGAVTIAVHAVREILTPHHAPAPFTLVVVLAVVFVKEILFRRVFAVGQEVESAAVQADAWHHRSDAITSGAAALGIAVALIGGPGWEEADDWAALVAAAVIFGNGVRILRPSVADLMDRTPDRATIGRIHAAAMAVPEVRAVETLKVRRSGLGLYVDIHVEADPEMPLREAHIVSGKVKTSIRREVPTVLGVLVHMEPHPAAEAEIAIE
jgi:cation diffusion facilitator family transporter